MKHGKLSLEKRKRKASDLCNFSNFLVHMSFITLQNVLDIQSSSQKDFLLEDWGNFDQVGAGQKQARLD